MDAFQEYRALMTLSPTDKRAINKRNWKATNERRLALLDKEDDLGLSAAETLELEHLQELAGVHRGRSMWYSWMTLSKLQAIVSPNES